MKIAIAVHGRFYGFDLARELLRRGHEVTLLTNYPARIVERFDVPRRHVKSCVWHGVAARAAWRLRDRNNHLYPEAFLHRAFGRWVAHQISRERGWDCILVWSGVALEVLEASQPGRTFRAVSRASSHIRTQARLLAEEEHRTGAPQDRPSAWMVGREEREYARADGILVLSSFARASFLEAGVPGEKLAVLALGARLETFRAAPEVLQARCQRLLAGAPLHVLYVGAASFRKGLWDLGAVARCLGTENFEFRCVGPITPEVSSLVDGLIGRITFVPKRPEHDLPQAYAWGDVFLFPTIEDGYPVVLAQAAAAGLPIITTPNCSGPDMLRDGASGWVLPIRSPQAIAERLRWCDANRQTLVRMIGTEHDAFHTRDWSEVAADFERLAITARDKGSWGAPGA